MTVDIETIGIAYDTSGLEKGTRALKENEGAANRTADAADKVGASGKRAYTQYADAAATAERQTRALSDTTATLTRLLGAAGAAMGGAQLFSYIDQYTKYTAQLKLAASGATEFANAQNQVRRIARESQTDLAATGVLYARITNGTRELGVAQAKVTAITEAINLSLKASGATAMESQSAMLQLSQAFASGTLRGEEFNAVNEAAPRLMKALADGIGVPVGALKEMASEGKITSAVMAEALPKALADLRKEAANVQTIGGAFTVLKNNVMEFVGAQAQANGTAKLISGSIELVANNLNLLTGAATGFAAAKLAQTVLQVGMALQAGIATTLESVAAQQAQRAASIAQAQAEVANTAAKVAGLTASNAALVISREETIAKLQMTNTTIASTEAQIVAARSAGALSFALATLRQGEQQLTAAMAARSAIMTELAVLGRQQASVTAAMTAATTAQAAAQAGLGTATAASGAAAGLATRALGLLGGPIGIVTTLLGLGVTAWMAWGSASASSERQATEAVDKSTGEIVDDLNRQIAKLKERNALAAAGMPDAAKKSGEAAERLIQLQKQINELQQQGTLNGSGKLPEAVRLDLLHKLTAQYGQLAGAMGGVADEQRKLDQTGKIVTDLAEAKMRLAGIDKSYLETLKTLQEARAKGNIGEREYVDLVSELATQTYKKSQAGKEDAKATKEQNQAAKQAQTQYESLMVRLKERSELAEEELKYGRALTESERHAIKVEELLTSGKSKLTAAQAEAIRADLAATTAKEKLVLVQRGELAQAQEIARARSAAKNADYDSGNDSIRDQQADYARTIASINERILSLKNEAEAVRIAELQNVSLATAIELVYIARLKERQLQLDPESENYKALDREIEKRKELLGLIQAREVRDGWNGLMRDVYQGLTDSLYRGFEAGKGFFKAFWDGVKNTLKTTVLKVLVQGVMNMTGLSSLAGGGGGVGGAASAAGGIGNMLGGVGAMFGAGGLGGSLMAGAGWLTGATTLGGSLGAAASLIGTGTGAGIMSGLGMMAGALGPIALGVVAIMALLKGHGETRSGGQYLNGQLVAAPSGGEIGSGIGAATTAAMSTINSTLAMLGSALRTVSLVGGLESSDKGKAFAYGGGALNDGTVFGQGIDGMGYMNRRGNMTGEQASAAFQTEMKQTILQGLQAVARSVWNDLPEIVARQVRDVDLDAMDDSQLDQLLTNINNTVVAINQFGAALNLLPFDNLKGKTTAWLATLMDTGVTIEQLSQFVSDFYTEAEQRSNVAKNISAALARVGVDKSADQVLEMTRAQFRKLFESFAPGSEQYAAMLSVAGAFASITPAAAATGESLSSLEQALAKLRNPLRTVEEIANNLFSLERQGSSLQIELQRAMGDNEGADSLQRALDTAGFTQAEIALYDYNKALLKQVERLNAVKAEADRVAGSLKSLAERGANLQVELMRLQGNNEGADNLQRALDTVGFTDVELAAYAFNKALERQIELFQKAAQAAEERAAQERSFYENFAPESYKRQRTAEGIANTMNSAGLGIAISPEEVLALTREKIGGWMIEAINAGEEGKPFVQLLLDLGDAFASIIPWGEEAKTTVRDVAASLKALGAETMSLKVQVMRSAGNDAGADILQRSIDTEGMTEAEIAIYDYNVELRKQIDMLNEAAAKAQQVAATRASLETQLLQLQGNTTELRRRELVALVALDPALGALQEQIWGLQDAAASNTSLMDEVTRTRDILVGSYRREASSLEQTISQMRDFAKGIREFKQSLLLDDSLSPLSPAAKYNTALQEFNSTSAAAKGGDVNAIARMQSVSSNFLEASRAFYGSADQYTRDFNLVQQALGKVAMSANSEAARAQQQLGYIKSQLRTLESIDETAVTIVDALAAYHAAIMAAIAAGLSPDNPLAIGLTAAANIPSFGAGGSHAGGLAWVGEYGKELVELPPARIYTANQSRSIVNGAGAANDSMAQEIRALREEVRLLRRENNRGHEANALATIQSGSTVSGAVRDTGSRTKYEAKLRAGGRTR